MMLRLLATPRWLGILALTIVFAIVCCAFGVWQWNRREEALAAIDRLERNYDRAPAQLADVLPSLDAFELPQQWTPVTMEGEYLDDEQLLLRGRSRDGQLGFDHIVPFRTRSGAIFLVDRGWMPVGATPDAPASEPIVPEGVHTIVARLRPNEGDIAGRGAPEGQIASVNLDTIAAELGEPTYTGAYGLLVTEDGAEPADLAAATRPVLDEGPHLSYCLQWFVFALLGFVAFGWALRREANSEADEPQPTRIRRRTDADVEDEILDRA